ncbi:hypothetical protein LA080_001958 [Diaporthe eres]|nr:hypothetical protein LA080_001958 [Diaporthe eres]
MAVLIYLAKWWKPKDTSHPATLHFYGFAEDFRDLPDRKHAFTQRTLSPTKVIDKAGRAVPRYIKRVANDVLCGFGCQHHPRPRVVLDPASGAGRDNVVPHRWENDGICARSRAQL